MAQRLLSPAFGLFDDAQTLRVAREVISGNYDFPLVVTQPSGRFFPAYWYFFVPGYLLWGERPLGFLIVNTVSLIITSVCLSKTVAMISGSNLAGTIAGVLFLLAPPIIENYYTVSKSEPILTLYIIISVLCLVTALQASRYRLWFFYTISLIMLPLAHLTKETALVLFPIGIFWAVGYALAQHADATSRRNIWLLSSYAAFNLLCFGAARLLARSWAIPGISSGNYTQNYRLSTGVLIHSLQGQLLLLARDYGFVFCALLALTVLFIYGRWIFAERRLGWVIGATVIWVGGWVGVLIPWQNSVQEYYLLPASLGLCAGSAIIVQLALRFWRENNSRSMASRIPRVALCLCCAGASILIIGAQVNARSDARIQVELDNTNSAFINTIARIAPYGATILLNIGKPNEMMNESQFFLSIFKGRPDLKIDYLTTSTLFNRGRDTLIASLNVRSPSSQTVRIGAFGPVTKRWNKALNQELGPNMQLVYHSAESVPITWVTTNQWMCSALGNIEQLLHMRSNQLLCPDQPIVYRETFEYGWDITTLQNDLPQGRTSLGVFQPATATWRLRWASGEEKVVNFGQPGDIPLVGDWDGDGNSGIGVYSPSTGEWQFDNNIDGRADVTIHWPEMKPNDIPVVGDWNGDLSTSIGFFRRSDVSWHLRNNLRNNSDDLPIIRFGKQTDIPLAGNWDSSKQDHIALYRPSTGQVIIWDNGIVPGPVVEAQHIPVITFWRSGAPAAVSTFAQGSWNIRAITCACAASDPLAPETVSFGQAGDIPVTGDWYEQ